MRPAIAMAPSQQTAVHVVGKDGELTDKTEDNVRVIHDAPVPKPEDGEVLVRVKYRCDRERGMLCPSRSQPASTGLACHIALRPWSES